MADFVTKASELGSSIFYCAIVFKVDDLEHCYSIEIDTANRFVLLL